MTILREEAVFDGSARKLVEVVADANPGVTNDELEGYRRGSKWINQSTDTTFVCTDPTAGAAVWAVSTGGAGCLASARLGVATKPQGGDTVTVGSDVYEFASGSGDLSNDAYIGVELGADAEACLDNLIAAINAQDANNQHASIKQTDSTTPALANGTEAVRAVKIGTTALQLESASEAGGQQKAMDPSIVLGEGLTDASDVWDVGNVNLNTLAGKVPEQQFASATLAITSAMVTAGAVWVVPPFTPTTVLASVMTSAGVVKAIGGADKVEISGSYVKITLAGGGGASDINNTDVVQLFFAS